MIIGYRSVLRLRDRDDAIRAAESQLSAWLRSKRRTGIEISDWDGPGEYQIGARARLQVVHDDERQDRANRRLYRLFEDNDAGSWVVSVYALSAVNARSTERQTIIIETSTDAADTRSAIKEIGTPRIVRQILEAHHASDGEVQLTGRPHLVRGSEAESALAAVLNPNRTASVIIAPSPSVESEDKWSKIVGSLTSESVGIASTFVFDAAATQVFNSGLPPTHGVSQGVIRTYAPRVDVGAPEDRLRHLLLFPNTLIRSLSGSSIASPLAKRHAENARLRLIERELPSDVRRGLDILRRAEVASSRTEAVERTVRSARARIEAATTHDLTRKSTAPGQVTLLLREWFGDDIATLPTEDAIARIGAQLKAKSAEATLLERQLEDTVKDNETLRTTLEVAKVDLEELELSVTIAEDEVRKERRTTTYFRQQLAEVGERGPTYVPPDDDAWQPPDGIYELLDRLTPGVENHPVFKRVRFTGAAHVAMEIEKRGQGMRYAHAFWDYVRVLYDYAEGQVEGRIRCGVHAYLHADHLEGHKCPADRHAPTESNETLQRWGRERTFPVPRDVHATGAILMDAHFRPTWSDTFAPRMYYYDDAANSGVMYIGYIGKHLRNTKT